MTGGPMEPAALQNTLALLEHIQRAYDKTADATKRRQCWRLQLNLLMALAYKLDLGSFLRPLRDMSLALESLDSGVAEPPLQPQRAKGRPKSARGLMLRSLAAASATLMIETGMPPNTADAIVARQLTKAGFKKPGVDGSITGKTILGWRAEVSRAAFDDPIRIAYDAFAFAEDPDAAARKTKTMIPLLRFMYSPETGEVPEARAEK
jgi:hypothetical protein